MPGDRLTVTIDRRLVEAAEKVRARLDAVKARPADSPMTLAEVGSAHFAEDAAVRAVYRAVVSAPPLAADAGDELLVHKFGSAAARVTDEDPQALGQSLIDLLARLRAESADLRRELDEAHAASAQLASSIVEHAADAALGGSSRTADISSANRRFEVWLDRNVVGADPVLEIVDVDAGEDANEICREVLDVMIQNELDTGWRKVAP